VNSKDCKIGIKVQVGSTYSIGTLISLPDEDGMVLVRWISGLVGLYSVEEIQIVDVIAKKKNGAP
jgi:hypothetical protein